jgi:tartrate/fumarate subfamily iron-sulfur-dependent hydro-lyase alpha chain
MVVPEPAFYEAVERAAAETYVRALIDVPADVRAALDSARRRETHPIGTRVLELVALNIRAADEHRILVCQDTGTPVYWVFIGSGLAVDGVRLENAIRRGVEAATRDHSLRSSICHPLSRANPQTNTGYRVPVVHLEFVAGVEYLDLVMLPKGSGSENQSFLKMLSPADGVAGIKKFILESVVEAGPKGCPPYIVGVGLGGSADLCMVLAKRALLRPIGSRNPDPAVAALEAELLEAINRLGIGPQGLGGVVTALAVHIEHAYTHISQNPVAVNIQCWRGLRAAARVHPDGRTEVLDRWQPPGG